MSINWSGAAITTFDRTQAGNTSALDLDITDVEGLNVVIVIGNAIGSPNR